MCIRDRVILTHLHIDHASAIEYEIKDPRLAGVTITDSKVTGDLHDATLYYTCLLYTSRCV